MLLFLLLYVSVFIVVAVVILQLNLARDITVTVHHGREKMTRGLSDRNLTDFFSF